MTIADKDKIKRLEKILALNYKFTQYLAVYLENCPELITRDMINELTSDSDISRSEAFCAILAEAFALDDARGGDERRLIRDYLRPSVRELDAKRYTENDYYKNVKIENVRDGKWELKKEVYPAYRGVVAADMIVRDDLTEIVPIGFFAEDFHFPAVLENGNEWMTLTPVDLDTSEDAINSAHGKVVTFGLGLGYFAYMAANKDNVESVTVVELSDGVISLFKKHILPQFPHSEKIRIINADAFEYAEREMPSEEYDFAFVDTWRDASDGAPMYVKMKKLEHLSPKTEFSYWIENFLTSRLRSQRIGALLDEVYDGREGAPDSYEEFKERLNGYG